MTQCDQALWLSAKPADFEGLLRKFVKNIYSKSAKFAALKGTYLIICGIFNFFLRILIETLWSHWLSLSKMKVFALASHFRSSHFPDHPRRRPRRGQGGSQRGRRKQDRDIPSMTNSHKRHTHLFPNRFKFTLPAVRPGQAPRRPLLLRLPAHHGRLLHRRRGGDQDRGEAARGDGLVRLQAESEGAAGR